MLANLRLGIRNTGYQYQNSFQDCAQQLEDLNCASPEATRAGDFIEQIEHADYDHVVESLKTTADLTLEDCYCKVMSKATGIAKPKPRDNATLAPRSMGIKLPPPPVQATEAIDAELCKKEDGAIFLP